MIYKWNWVCYRPLCQIPTFLFSLSGWRYWSLDTWNNLPKATESKTQDSMPKHPGFKHERLLCRIQCIFLNLDSSTTRNRVSKELEENPWERGFDKRRVINKSIECHWKIKRKMKKIDIYIFDFEMWGCPWLPFLFKTLEVVILTYNLLRKPSWLTVENHQVITELVARWKENFWQ